MTSDYSDKVGLLLMSMKTDEVFSIPDKVRPENRDTFIQCVKDYIDRDFGNKEGWQILFSSDYGRIRKDYYLFK